MPATPSRASQPQRSCSFAARTAPTRAKAPSMSANAPKNATNTTRVESGRASARTPKTIAAIPRTKKVHQLRTRTSTISVAPFDGIGNTRTLKHYATSKGTAMTLRVSMLCIVTLCALFARFAAVPAEAAGQRVDPTTLVDPLVGTSGNGFDGPTDTFPGADAPFGMVQWSPDTPSQPAGGGYNYNDSAITGFSLTHLSGPGCNVFGDIGILPTIGAVTAPAGASQLFSHASEVATPGYYEIMLGMPSIRARLAASTRAGIGSFTFPATPQANVLVNASSNQAGVGDTDVRVVGNDEVAGSATSGWFCGMPGKYTVYFVLHFDRPFVAHGTWLVKHVMPQTEEAKGAGAGAWVTFDTSADPTIRMKAAVSWVSNGGAETNAR